MDAKTASLIVQAGEELGLEIQRRDDYSGRGMYGSKTAGIVGSLGDILQATAKAALELGRSVGDQDIVDYVNHGHDGQEFVENLSSLSVDNMGKSDLIVY